MNNVAEEMRHLNELAKRDPSKRFTKLWNNLTDMKWLTQAWEEIRRNGGSQTPGINSTVAADVDLALIEKLKTELETGKYRPSPVRRVLIPKANGKTRPLGIANLEDRIVQQAVRMLLEPIFEADFLSCSYGFRQAKSTHTALRDVAVGYSSTTWIIEGDIEACYDSIPTGALVKQIKRRIADEKVLQLIWRFLKAGYLEDWKYYTTYSGIPQGNIAGPLLCNIFLHQLDEFMVNELQANKVQSAKEARSRRNPEYTRLHSRIQRIKRKLKKDVGDKKENTIKLKELNKQVRKTPCYDKDKRHPSKVKYIRYADDFVVLVAGNKQEAEAIKNRVASKLSEMGLKLSEEKTKLTHWSKSYQFLGYEVQGKINGRGVGTHAVLTIPHKKFTKVVENITQVSSYYHIPEIDVIAQLSAIFRGWCNYYRYANNCTRVFSSLSSKMWWAYARFLARKKNMSIRQVLKQEKLAGNYGIIKRDKRARVTFSIAVGKKRWILDIFPPRRIPVTTINSKQDWEVDLRPVKPLSWQRGRSLATRLEALERSRGICEKCRERKATQVHHTIPIKRKSFLARVMSDKNQKYTAIALCNECHSEKHPKSHNPRQKRSVQNAEVR
ncbi:MAG: group II intron reverse transcriptase/maturase [Blastocatellia bacterium]|nr:group II intron reverse transcriptase/maturase [Blastocatellia bacterium]